MLAIIGNGFDLLDIDTTYQQLVQGVLILLAVAADQLVRRRAMNRMATDVGGTFTDLVYLRIGDGGRQEIVTARRRRRRRTSSRACST